MDTKGRIQALEKLVKGLQEEVEWLRAENAQLRQENGDLKLEVERLRQKFSGGKGEMIPSGELIRDLAGTEAKSAAGMLATIGVRVGASCRLSFDRLPDSHTKGSIRHRVPNIYTYCCNPTAPGAQHTLEVDWLFHIKMSAQTL